MATAPRTTATITPDELLARLGRLDAGAMKRLVSAATMLLAGIDEQPEALLSTAIARALSPQNRRPDIDVRLYLFGVMHSIASSIARSRERSVEVLVDPDALKALVGRNLNHLSADELIDLKRRMSSAEVALDELAIDEDIAALIAGLSFGKRGAELAEQIGGGPSMLATTQRRMKRQVPRIRGQMSGCESSGALLWSEGTGASAMVPYRGSAADLINRTAVRGGGGPRTSGREGHDLA